MGCTIPGSGLIRICLKVESRWVTYLCGKECISITMVMNFCCCNEGELVRGPPQPQRCNSEVKQQVAGHSLEVKGKPTGASVT